MRAMIFLALLAVPVFLAPAVVVAAEAYNPQIELLAKLNRIHPLQNPRYEPADRIIGRRILDRKSKVMGVVEDVVLNKNGNIAFLNVVFDRMQLNRPVFVNYGAYDIRPASNGYVMAFESGDIKNIYPAMLADIQTAAGGDDETFSLIKFDGVEVWTESGRKIGAISDVLFNAEGQRAESIYITLTSGPVNGRGVAVPFAAVNLEKFTTERRVTVTDQTADAMIAQAKG